MTAFAPFILWVVIGLLSGAVAGLQFNNLLRYLAAGVAGGVLGGYLLAMLGWEFPLTEALLRHLISGTIGATAVILLVKFLE